MGSSLAARLSRTAHLWKALTQQHHRDWLPLLRRLVPPDATVIDVGAHAGQFTKLFARHLVPRGRVVAIEPGAYALGILRPVLRWHRLRNVALVEAALGAEAGRATLSVPTKAGGQMRFGLASLGALKIGGKMAGMASEGVAVERLDDLVERLGLSRVALVKIDVEGFEMQALKGAARLLAEQRPLLVLELMDGHLARAGDSLAGALESLRAAGYRPYLRDGAAGLRAAAPDETPADWIFLPQERTAEAG